MEVIIIMEYLEGG